MNARAVGGRGGRHGPDRAGGTGWFRVARLDETTFLINEPWYWQRNNQYLLVGAERALLFDSGPGLRDISAVVAGSSPVPIVVLASHSHYDHIGNHHRFEQVAMADLAVNRSQVRDGEFRPRLGLRCAPRPRHFGVTEWWPLGEPIDLGGRTVELVHLPGHTADSIGLVDPSHGYVFTGDFLCRSGLGAVVPTSSVRDYRASALRLLDLCGDERLLGAHYDPFPALGRSALERIVEASDALLARPTRLPLTYARRGGVTLWATRSAVRRGALRRGVPE